MSESGDYKTKDFKSQDFSSVGATPLVANPAPLGLAAFGITTFVLSCYNATMPPGQPPMIVLGLALFYGGVTQLLAGMWEFKAGNTFGATAFSSYGAFWLSYACILIPDLQETTKYTEASALSHAIGIYLLAWTIFTFIMFLCTLKQNIASILLFGMLDVTFLLLAISSFQNGNSNSKTCAQAAGFCGIITAFIALYIVLANLANKEHTYFTLPVGVIGGLEKKIYE
jgi:succinate-acetate transporter protein